MGATAYRFLLTGVANTALGLAVIFLAQQFVSPVLANAIGYLIVVPASFLAHRSYSFRDDGALKPAFGRYLLTVAIGYLANRLTLEAGLAVDWNPYVVQTLAIAAHVVTTFLLSKTYVFRQQR